MSRRTRFEWLRRSASYGRGRRRAPLRSSLFVESLELRQLLSADDILDSLYYLPQQRQLVDLSDGYLTGPNAGAALDIATSFLKANAGVLGITATDVDSAQLFNQYVDTTSGTTYFYFQQTVNGLQVVNTSINVNIGALGQVINVGCNFVSGADVYRAQANATPSLAADDALVSAGSALGILSASEAAKTSVQLVSANAMAIDRSVVLDAPDLSQDDVPGNLVYVPTAAGNLSLAWKLLLRTPDNQHWYNATIDATSGTLLGTDDWIDHDTYDVFDRPSESPSDGGRVLVSNPADPLASPYGWHDTNGAAGAEFTDTRGNNVSAQEDHDNNNTGGYRPDGGPSLTFDFSYSASQDPTQYVDAAITNLFYWNNLLHDIHYHYGFTEAAGNFQVNNYGRGGLGNDAVQADAQDGSGTNNANFSTPSDGSAPRMQMYIWTYTTPNRDSDLDNGVIIHEYGHGVSNRLTGGGVGISALQTRGMGEGWSDWWALMLTQKATDPTSGSYGVGTYVIGQASNGVGIRAYPYSIDKSVDPLTMASFNSNNEVHAVGTMWCSALWDITCLLEDKYGFSPNVMTGYTGAGSAGNILALQLVMDALKLQPANPTFLEARDAVLLADQVLTGGQNQVEIWTAFARRGMGLSAVDASSAGTSVTEAFDLPNFSEHVIGVTPAAGSIVATPPTSFSVQFADDYDPASIAASDFVVNGVAATSFTLQSPDTVVFKFNASPVTVQGLQTMSMADGVVTRLSDGTTSTAYAASFRYDVLLLAVTSTTPTSGSTVQLPLTTFDFHFNEAVDPASVSASDLLLTQGAVASVTVVDPTTVRFTLSGVNVDSTLSVGLAAGSIKDVYGNDGAAYADTFTLDVADGTHPTLTRLAPLGGLLSQGSVSSTIGWAGDVDDFLLDLAVGQFLTLLAHPNAPTLMLIVQVWNPANTIVASGAATTAGQDVALPTLAVTTAGSYKIRLSSASGTTGAQTLRITVNASAEQESLGGSRNDSAATAENLTTATIHSGGIDRYAVTGGLQSVSDTIYASEDFESGALGGAWSTYSSDSGGRIQVSGAYGTHGGAKALYMDRNPSGTYTLNEATWTVNLTGRSQVWLSFYQAEQADEENPFAGDYVGHYNADGVSISNDGVHWHPIWMPVDQPAGAYARYIVDLAAAATAAGLTLGSNFQIKFQQYDNFPLAPTNLGSSDGREWDDVALLYPIDDEDWYSVSLAAGERASFAMSTANSAAATLSVIDAAGHVLARSTTDSNGYAAAQAWAPTAGTYYVVASGIVATTYDLVGVRDGVLNDTVSHVLSTPQALGATGNALGYLDSQADYYAFQTTGGALSISTTTPFDASNDVRNLLDPMLQLYDASGTLVASNDNGAADGRNALLNYTATAGVYTLRVSAAGGTSGEYVLHAPTSSLVLAPKVTGSIAVNEDAAPSGNIVIARNADDGPEAAYIKLTALFNGSLYQHDGVTPITDGQFITTLQANAGLKFKPAADFNGGLSFQAWSSLTPDDVGLSDAPTLIPITVTPVNDVPAITLGANRYHVGNPGAQTVVGWAPYVSAGAGDESGQTLTLAVTNDNNALFSVQPTIDAAGTLRYAPSGLNGTAVVSVALRDDGGTALGGIDTAAVQTFTIQFVAAVPLPSGSLDASFDGDGMKFLSSAFGTEDVVRDAARQADGKYVVVGTVDASANLGGAVVRYNVNGSLDTTFGVGGIVRLNFSTSLGAFTSVVVQTDGKIVVGGYTNSSAYVARLNSDGSLDATFGTSGVFTNALGNTLSSSSYRTALALQTDGKIVLTKYSYISGTYGTVVARLTTAGALDTTFAATGYVTFSIGVSASDIPYDVALQSDGKIVVAGSAGIGTTSTTFDYFAARFNTDGSLDTTFNGGLGYTVISVAGTTVSDIAYRVAIQSDGRIVLAGQANGDFGLVRLNSDGTLDASFDGDGIQTTNVNGTDGAFGLTLQADGRIVTAGYSGTLSSAYDFTLIRYNADGSLDTTFDGDGIRTLALSPNGEQAYGVLAQSDGKLFVAGGVVVDPSSAGDFVAARLNADGSVDTSFDGDGVTTPLNMSIASVASHAVLSLADGTTLVGGYIRKLSSTALTTLSQFAAVWHLFADGSLDTSFGTGGYFLSTNSSLTDVSKLLLQSDGRIIVVGYANSRAARISAAGVVDTTFGSSGYATLSSTTYAAALQSDGKLVVAGTSSSNFAVARYTTAGVLDTTFGTAGVTTVDFAGGSDFAYAVALQSDGKIVVAGDASNGSNNDMGVARLNADGTLDASFDTDGKLLIAVGTSTDSAHGVAVLADGRIVVGGYAYSSTTSYDPALVRLNSDGSFDTTFGSGGKATAALTSSSDYGYAMLVAADGTYYLAGYTTDSSYATFVAHFLTNGALDTSFDGDGFVLINQPSTTEFSYDLARQSDGRLLVAGYCYDLNNLPNPYQAVIYRIVAQTMYVSPNPTATPIAVQTVLAGQTSAPVTFSVFDTTVSAASLSASAVSSNPSLIQNSGLALTNLGGGNWQLTVTPVGSNVGTSTITVQVSDGFATFAETFVVKVANVNSAPSFVKGSNKTVNEDAGPQTYVGWATGLSIGAGDTGQALDFLVTNDNNGLFSVQPTIAADGTLTFTPAASVSGSATVTVRLHDDGGTLGGGQNTSAPQTLTITVNAVNDPPTFVAGAAQSFVGNPGAQSIAGWASFSPGPNESSQTVAITVTNDNPSLFTVQPTLNAAGTLSFTPSGVYGSAVVTFTLTDNGGTAGGGADTTVGTTTITFGNGGASPTATLDRTFDGDGVKLLTSSFGSFDVARDMARQADGKYVVFGTLDNGANFTGVAARYNVDGSLDATFGSGGIARLPVSGSTAQFTAVVVQTDGKIVAAGNNSSSAYVIRLNADGTVDTTFGTAGVFSNAMGNVYSTTTYRTALALQSDGKIVLAKYYSTNGIYDTEVARLTTSGALDTGFNGTGYATFSINSAGYDVAYDVAVQSDNKIVIAGSSGTSSSSTTFDYFAARYNADGTLDITFGGSLTGYKVISVAGTNVSDVAYRVAIQNDGKIVLAGQAGSDYGLVRLTTDGVLDTTFDADGILTTNVNGTDGAFGLALQSDGKIVAAGFSGSATTTYDFSAVRYNGDGSLDTTFDGDGKRTISFGPNAEQAYGVLVQSDGKIVVAGGAVTSANNGGDYALARMNADGSLDTSFDGDGFTTLNLGTTTADARTILALADGTSLVGGYMEKSGGTSLSTSSQYGAVWHLRADGSLDTSFGTGGFFLSTNSSLAEVSKILVQSDGKFLLIGYDSQRVARITAAGAIDASWGSSGYLTLATSLFAYTGVLQTDGKLVVTGSLSSNFGIARYTTTGAIDSTFGTAGVTTVDFNGSSDTAYSVALQSDGKIVVVGDAFNGSTDMGVVRLNTNGTLDTTFDGDGKLSFPIGTSTDSARSVAVLTDGRIVIVGYTFISAGYDPVIVRLNADGSFDSTFGTGGKITTAVSTSSDYGYALLVAADGTYYVGGYTLSSGYAAMLLHYFADGKLDTAFDGDGILLINQPATTEFYYGISQQPDGRILIAGYQYDSTVAPTNYVATVYRVFTQPTYLLPAPSVTPIADQIVQKDAAFGPLDFTVSHDTLSAGSVSASAASSNQAVVTNANLSLTNLGAGHWRLSAVPTAGAVGSTIITVTASGGGASYAETFTLTYALINTAPSFTKGTDQNISKNTGVHSVSNWATGVSVGPSRDAGQTPTFIVVNDNAELFSLQPTIAADGTLSYSLASGIYGTAVVTARLKDDGGTTSGGQDTSIVQTFVITVTNNAAPTVVGVYAKGSSWQTSYSTYLWNNGMGSGVDSTLGFLLSNGANQLKTLPWTNVNTISIQFSEAVTISSNDLAIIGASNGGALPSISGMSWNASTFVATWTFSAALVRNKYLLHLGNTVVDAGGATLDGEWTTSVSTVSGDGVSGGDFNFRFNVLPSDNDGSNSVTLTEVLQARNRAGKGTLSTGYTYREDSDGSGTITLTEVLQGRNRAATSITGLSEPIAPGSSPQLAAVEAPPVMNADGEFVSPWAPLTLAELDPIVAEAKRRWEASGLVAGPIDWSQLHFAITDLGGILGLTDQDGLVRIDDDGAGWSWFVDETPADDNEFATTDSPVDLTAVVDGPAAGRSDLLTTVMHELGIFLGFRDIPTDRPPTVLMTETLGVSERRLAVVPAPVVVQQPETEPTSVVVVQPEADRATIDVLLVAETSTISASPEPAVEDSDVVTPTTTALLNVSNQAVTEIVPGAASPNGDLAELHSSTVSLDMTVTIEIGTISTATNRSTFVPIVIVYSLPPQAAPSPTPATSPTFVASTDSARYETVVIDGPIIVARENDSLPGDRPEHAALALWMSARSGTDDAWTSLFDSGNRLRTAPKLSRPSDFLAVWPRT